MKPLTLRVDAYSSLSQYRDHVLPVFRALPESSRGTFHVPGHILTDPLLTRGRPHLTSPNPIIVASYRDLKLVHSRPVILMEHGSGQSYSGVHDGSYAGGVGRESVVLFLCPNPTVAAANKTRYPNTPTAIIGSPYLDYLRTLTPAPRQPKPVVALTWHWDSRVVPETRSAFPEYQSTVVHLAANQDIFTLLGHSHPRIWGQAERFYTRVGIEPVPDFTDVIRRADVLLADNSSAIPLAAACGLKVGWLNSSHYRRNVTHNQRFWGFTEHIPTADSPDNLMLTSLQVLADTPIAKLGRIRMIEDCFGALDGKAADRAVEAILNF